MNSINLVARVHSVPSYALVGASNRQLLKFLIILTRQAKADSTRLIELAVIIWGNKAEAAYAKIKKGDTIAISGELDFDAFSAAKDQESRSRTIIIASTIDILTTATAPQP